MILDPIFGKILVQKFVPKMFLTNQIVVFFKVCLKILRDQVDFLSGAKHAPDMPQGPKLQVCKIFYLVVRTPGGEILTN